MWEHVTKPKNILKIMLIAVALLLVSMVMHTTFSSEIDRFGENTSFEQSARFVSLEAHLNYTDNEQKDLVYSILTSTLEDPIGMQGFIGEYALNDPDKIVEIAVQFVTPPAVALRLLQEDGYSNIRPLSEQIFEEQALEAHSTFREQLQSIAIARTARTEIVEIFNEHHSLFNGVFMRAPQHMVAQIAELPEVFAVFPNITISVEPIEGQLIDQVTTADFPHNNEARALFNIDYIHNTLGFTGAGVRVAVLDSGVDYNHPDLVRYQDPNTGRIRGRNFVPFFPDDQIMDFGGHGTHVSGTVVAMAPDVELWHYKVLTCLPCPYGGMGDCGGFTDWIIDGIEEAHREGMDVINLSMDRRVLDPLLSNALNLASLDGMVTVVSGGNDGPNWETINLMTEATLPIFVAAGTLGGVNQIEDTIADLSSRGPFPTTYRISPDITAPGYYIHSTFLGGTYYITDGTSMAAPAVAGVSALMLNAYPDAYPDEIKARLMNSARLLADLPDADNSVFTVGAGFMQPFEALTNSDFVTVEDMLATMSSLSFGNLNSVLPNNLSTMTANVYNGSRVARTYTIDHMFTNNPNDALTITLSRRTLTVAPGETGQFTVTTSFRGNVPNGFYEGYIYVRESGNQVARLPFAVVNSGSAINVSAHSLSFNLGGTAEHPTIPGTIDSINVNAGTNIVNFIRNNHRGFTHQYGGLAGGEPKREGYTFAGWYLDINFQQPLSETTTMSRATTLHARWHSTGGSSCNVIANGQFPNQPANQGGMVGASWVLCDDGTVEVSEGFIHWATIQSPWHNYRTQIREITFTGPITAGTSLIDLFHNLSNVTTISGLEYFDTSNVSIMFGMFSFTSSLTNLDLSNWDTSNVTDMSYMFAVASGLTSLDLSNWDTSSVTNMRSMFSLTRSLTSLDVASFDTSNVTNMSSMFSHASGLTSLDLSSWDTSNVTNMSSMFFWGASSLTSLDLSNWDTGNVTNMHSMFSNTSGLTSLDLSNWDTSNVTNMGNMFWGASSLRTLTLGENFVFRGGSLPMIPATTEFTGYWQNVGNGTIEQPRGVHVLTSTRLMETYNGATMADTWVWQPRE